MISLMILRRVAILLLNDYRLFAVFSALRFVRIGKGTAFESRPFDTLQKVVLHVSGREPKVTYRPEIM